ncbi:CD209 antigen-like protein A isoform X1 [Apteryx mantelli]|uniref:CD209 antigen-like protein A isoform X1 n=1 Tax=Apteryx mantelli TaxID=2696672 RepID=A0ABM4G0N2_9AVES
MAAVVAAGVGGRWGRGNTSNTSLYRRQRPGRAGLHARKLLAPGQPRRQQLPPNCRADSPDSFVDEDDYDDVSLSEPDRNHRKPPAEEDLQSQRSKGGTGVYVLAGKPASSSTMRMRDSDARAGAGRGCREKPVVILYVLVALSFAMWVAILSLVMVKYSELSRELKMLSSNYSESVLQELADTRRGQDRMRTKMSTYYQELQDITALICKALPDSRRCSAGWKIFEKSCYSFSTESLSWEDAKQICSDQGSHLVIVNTELEQKFLKDNINSSSTYWLGLTDKLEEGTWLWINGEPASISYWNTWRENRDKEQQDCGSIGPDGIWTDERCSRAHHWICEKSWHC